MEKFVVKKSELLGEEKFFSGNLRSNSLSNAVEMNIEVIENVNTEDLIKELEAKSV